MTPFWFIVILLSEICTVAGQIFMKHAMTRDEHDRNGFHRNFAAAIAFMAMGFFIWNSLLGHFDLSYLYPFEGLNRVMLVLGAMLILKEKITPPLWVGVLLISAGVVLVSSS